MKKLFSLAITVLFVISLGGCVNAAPESVKAVIKPGDKIGEMTVEQSTEIPYYNLWWFCEIGPDEQEPFAYKTDCEVPPVTNIDIILAWIAKESKFASNWEAMSWELYIDGHQIDLESFDWFEYEYVAKGENNKSRDLIITLKNLSPGKHTFQYSWKSDILVDDGWNVYQPGTYERVINFTVLEKEVYPKFSSNVNIGQHPYTSEKAQLDFLLYLPSEYGKDPQQKWPLIVYLHAAPLRGATLELLKNDEPLPRKLEKENDFPFIVVSPLGDGEYEFWAKDEMIDPLFTLLEEIRAPYSINEKKIYLTGSDMGGNGVWAIGLRYPEYFAALAPVAGYFGWPPEVPENICDLKDVPVWAFHGGRDDIIPVEAGQKLVDALNECGGNAKFTVSQDMKIDVLYKVYADPELYEWLLEQGQGQLTTTSSTEPPTAIPPVLVTNIEMLIGNWQPLSKGHEAMFLQINADGTCYQAYSLERLTNEPHVECAYTFEGTNILFTVVKLNGVPECPSPTGAYEVRLIADSQIELVAKKDSCAPRIRSTRGVYQHIP